MKKDRIKTEERRKKEKKEDRSEKVEKKNQKTIQEKMMTQQKYEILK